MLVSHGTKRRRRSRRARHDSLVLQRLRLINRRQREFLAVVSHELRTPLVAILGGIELLRQGGAVSGDGQAMILDLIETSATHLRDLLSDVLDLSSAAAGRMRVQLQPVPVTQVCSQAVSLVSATARAKRIEIDVEIDDPSACVRADPGRLRQVLANLLSNAVKFTPDEGRVGVRVMRGESSAVFEVWDGGPGLSREQVERLGAFEPYTRLTSSPGAPAGVGLGLTIVKQLVDLHAGRLSIHSVPGEGSRFRIEIPLVASGEAPDASVPASFGGNAGGDVDESAGGKWSADVAQDAAHAVAQGIRVLLVDDVPGNVSIASAYLRRAGFEVLTADSAQRALEILRHTPVDVLVCDVRMPHMDGVALTRLVRCDPGFAHLPIIALTASGDWMDRRRCLAAGMQDCLIKPLPLSDLARSIVRHCRPGPDGFPEARQISAELEPTAGELPDAPAGRIAGILHDINDALGAAIGNLDLASGGEQPCDRAMLRDAFDSCKRVAELLKELRQSMRGVGNA